LNDIVPVGSSGELLLTGTANLAPLATSIVEEPESKVMAVVPPTETITLPASYVYLTLLALVTVSWNSTLPESGII
jgi:hypothetical protein